MCVCVQRFTCVSSSLRACSASLLSSFTPLLSTASITWSRSGSRSTGVPLSCSSCGEHKHRCRNTCTRTHARSCTDVHYCAVKKHCSKTIKGTLDYHNKPQRHQCQQVHWRGSKKTTSNRWWWPQAVPLSLSLPTDFYFVPLL